MVVSLAVPAVVGTPMIGTPGRVVGDRPSRLSTSSKSGLVAITEIALHVSWGEPPPRPMSTSAPEARKAARPAWTFSIGGLGDDVGEDLPADAGLVEQVGDAGGGAVVGQDRVGDDEGLGQAPAGDLGGDVGDRASAEVAGLVEDHAVGHRWRF